jgi:hypothetical protein
LIDDERLNPRPKKEQADKPANIDTSSEDKVIIDEEEPQKIRKVVKWSSKFKIWK